MDDTRILVVDDEPFIRALLIDLVSDLNLKSDEAENGMAALELLKVKDYHVVLSDIKMPIMGGIELFENALKINIFTPFIFLTGYSDEKMVKNALRLGVIDFVAKPFLPLELSNVIVRTIEIGQRRLELMKAFKRSQT